MMMMPTMSMVMIYVMIFMLIMVLFVSIVTENYHRMFRLQRSHRLLHSQTGKSSQVMDLQVKSSFK